MSQGDMFLKIEATRQGVIKGEAQDKSHKDAIDVLAWSWGMQGNYIDGTASAKATIQDVRVTKMVDSSTTALMSCLRNNEPIKTATLTVRKAGGSEPVEYFKIVMEKARITSIQAQSGWGGDPAALFEDITIAFSKVNVEYKPQGADGLFRGSTMFETDIFEGK